MAQNWGHGATTHGATVHTSGEGHLFSSEQALPTRRRGYAHAPSATANNNPATIQPIGRFFMVLTTCG
jgi:hypothetical protein